MTAPTNAAANVAVGKPSVTGGVYRAVAGTTAPADVSTALVAAFKGVGYISDAGVVQSISADSSEIVAWGGDTVRKIQTKHDLTFKLTMIETNDQSQKAYYGDAAVTTTAATSSKGNLTAVKVSSTELPRGVWAFELKDGLRTGRIALPDAQVTDRGDVSYVDADAISYEVTLTCYPDATGVKAYIYWDDGLKTA